MVSAERQKAANRAEKAARVQYSALLLGGIPVGLAIDAYTNPSHLRGVEALGAAALGVLLFNQLPRVYASAKANKERAAYLRSGDEELPLYDRKRIVIEGRRRRSVVDQGGLYKSRTSRVFANIFRQ